MSLSQKLQELSQDAIFYVIEQEKSSLGTPAGKSRVLNEVVDMLLYINDEITRTAYIGEVSKMIGVTKTDINNLIKAKYAVQAEENEDNEEARVPEKYRKDVEEYGLYEEDNCYYFIGQSGRFERASNFVIHPLFHIYSKNDNKRLIQIKSSTGRSAILDMQSKNMVSLSNFQQAIFDEGNFLFEGTDKQFKRVLRKIGEEFPVANEIKTLGWQREGFYAFSNGIFNGKWTPIDELGIVKHDDVKYFLPAYSSVYKKVRQDDDEYENERHFRYEAGARENGQPITFKRWGEQMVQVFGDNGKVAVAYVATAMMRDIVYVANSRSFPHLFLFGEKQSGKSYLAWRLSNLFSHEAAPFNLSQGTDVGFSRKLSQSRNALIWMDEYADSINPKRIQHLKSAFDGAGHEKGVLSNDNRTKSTKVNSGLVISGQYLPTADDNALFTRSITLSFKKNDNRTPEEEMRGKLLESWEREGLSNVVTEIISLRGKFESSYETHRKAISKKLKNALTESVTDRLFNNVLVILTTADILDGEGMLPMKYSEFFDQCVEMIMAQHARVEESDSLRNFWEMLEFLSQSGMIRQGVDYKYETTTSIRLMSGRKENSEKVFPKAKRLFHFQWSKIHPLYMEKHRSQYGVSGLTRASLKHYLTSNQAFVGITRSTEFEDIRTSSYVFDADMLPFDLEKVTALPGTMPSRTGNDDNIDDELPF